MHRYVLSSKSWTIFD